MEAKKSIDNSDLGVVTNQQAPTTVMGLGLGMGIQMGSDGRFYASMGGVTMPNSNSAESD